MFLPESLLALTLPEANIKILSLVALNSAFKIFYEIVKIYSGVTSYQTADTERTTNP